MFPFTAIVGQSRARLALILAVVNPLIGGVLVRGEKGTAKSTMVRALGACLAPGALRTLTLSITEDRLIGSLDLEATLADGRPRFQPGLLAEADGGIVYVDEVNLLDDHLAHLVLDAAASGVVVVQRDGFSRTAPARFSLIGTMNPEEGGLGPQLLDRFGLCVDVVAERDLATRAEILARRLDHDADPRAFAARWADEERAFARRLADARELLPQVAVSDEVAQRVAQLCRDAQVPGHRADLAMIAAARAHAAWQGRTEVSEQDVAEVSEMTLAHRRRDPQDPPETPRQQPAPPPPSPKQETAPDQQPEPNAAEDQVAEIGESFAVRALPGLQDRLRRAGGGRRQQTLSADARGHQIGVRVSRTAWDLSLPDTLRAAAPHQRRRRHQQPDESLAILVREQDFRRRIRRRRTGSLVILTVDASASMGAHNRMVASKGAILSLLLDSYVHRDRVGLVSFRDSRADVLVPPTSSIELAERRLRTLPTGGRTPLATGLMTSYRLAMASLRTQPTLRPLIVVVTDGRGNVNQAGQVSRQATDEAMALGRRLAADRRVGWVVVDTQPGTVARRGRGLELADALSGAHFTLDTLRAPDLVRVIRSARDDLQETA